jgi:uncharacterized protein YecE (DUF72 family)
MKQGRLYIGTSGWSYAHWAKGRFYPSGMKPGDWLRFYTGRFRTVEVNMTFYHLPKEEMLHRWRGIAPEGFQYAVKMWRRITHEKRLRNCSEELGPFLRIAGILADKLGPLLVQLPPSFRVDAGLLDAFLADLRDQCGESCRKVAFEFRNREWLSDAVYEALNRHGASLCLSDYPRCTVDEPNATGMIYVRRHGPGGRYRGCYAPEHIARDADRIREWLNRGRDVYMYFNNDIEGYAVDNAAQLIETVQKKQPGL